MEPIRGDQVILRDPFVKGNSTPPRSHDTDDTAIQFATMISGIYVEIKGANLMSRHVVAVLTVQGISAAFCSVTIETRKILMRSHMYLFPKSKMIYMIFCSDNFARNLFLDLTKVMQ